MSDQTVKPALTPEEWEAAFRRAEQDGFACEMDVLLSRDYLSAAAFLLQHAAPDGTPWFTHEDADTLDAMLYDFGSGETGLLRAKFRALLPPRETP